MKSNSSIQSSRLLVEVRNGWQSARANVAPGLVIVFIAGLLAAAFYLFPVVSDSLQGLQRLRVHWGGWFSMAASAIGAGIIPGVYLILKGHARRGWRAGVDLFYTCFVWAASAMVIDRFYAFQDWWWGSAVTLPIVCGKMLTDQLIFTPLLGLQIPALGFRFRDMNYDLFALANALRTDWFIKVIVPMLVACWLTWIPGTLVVYALPLSLQIPMMVLIQCFFALEMAYASSKMNDSNEVWK
ncbi:MAG TPA: hypothetical protein VMU30_06975 [Bacteroidota bacterium]|nr:hypothetical protein [Bacteroidota bacterium]